jgi:hypothetical protein
MRLAGHHVYVPAADRPGIFDRLLDRGASVVFAARQRGKAELALPALARC